MTILAVANTALAAIQQGCELYKEYKGTVLKAKETFDEVKGIATEVVGVWGFIKGKLFPKKPSPPRMLGVPDNAGSLDRRAPRKVPKEWDEASIKIELVKQLKIFFKCQEQLQQKLAEAEERSLNTDVNTMESALDIEYVMVEIQQMQKQIRETMVYNSPKELGDLYTRVVKRIGTIQEQQELARREALIKTRTEKCRRDQRISRIQSRIIWAITIPLLALEVWLILLAVMMALS